MAGAPRNSPGATPGARRARFHGSGREGLARPGKYLAGFGPGNGSGQRLGCGRCRTAGGDHGRGWHGRRRDWRRGRRTNSRRRGGRRRRGPGCGPAANRRHDGTSRQRRTDGRGVGVRFHGNLVALGRLFDGGAENPVRGLRPGGVPRRRLALLLGHRGVLFGLFGHGHGAPPVIIGGGAGFRIRNVQPIKTPQADRHVFVNGAGVRLLFRDAQLGEPVQDFVSLDFQLPGQLVDSNLLHSVKQIRFHLRRSGAPQWLPSSEALRSSPGPSGSAPAA